MPIDEAQARQLSQDAVKKVLARWGNYIPADLRTVPASSMFVIHPDETSFRTAFNPMWDNLFRQAVNSTDPAANVPAPGGFVTAEVDRRMRKIHVNRSASEFDWVGLFAHEFIHWLSHPNFYPTYYKSAPGQANDVVEGVTDYLTLKCFKGYEDGLIPASLQQYKCHLQTQGLAKLPKSERAAYNWAGQYKKAKTWIKSATGNEAAVLDYVFGGKAIPLPF